ncbi:MAG: hypothetical protein WCX48_09670 [Bacteroidales bacterium]
MILKQKSKEPHTDNEFLLAIKLRSVDPWLPAAEIAEEIGADERRTRERLIKLVEGGILESKIHGNTRYFRQIKKE